MLRGDATTDDVRRALEGWSANWASLVPLACPDRPLAALLRHLEADAERALLPDWEWAALQNKAPLHDALNAALTSSLCSVDTATILGTTLWAPLQQVIRSV